MESLTTPLFYIHFFFSCFLFCFVFPGMCYVGNTIHCVYIYVFVNVYVVIAVYFPCLEEKNNL